MINKRIIRGIISGLVAFSVITGCILGYNTLNNKYSNVKANEKEEEIIEFEFSSSAYDKCSLHLLNKAVYDSRFFENPSTNYNHGLAKLSQALAIASSSTSESIVNWGENYNFVINTSTDFDSIDYAKHRNAYIVEIYKKLGFYNDIYVKYDTSLNDASNTCGYSIAMKQINVKGEEYTLVCATPRSGVYGSEWGSNFYLTEGNKKTGFQLAGEEFYEAIKKYIKGHKLGKNTKVWINGYSRGAGASNIAAALLDKDIENGMYDFAKEDVYAYMVATPMSTIDEETKLDKYNNIFNIVIESDLVATVAPKYWGYNRYGKVLTIPHLNATYSELKKIEAGKKVNIPDEKVQLMKAVSNSYNVIRYENVINDEPKKVTNLYDGFIVGKKINKLVDNVAEVIGEDVNEYGEQWQGVMVELVPFIISQAKKYDSEKNMWVPYDSLAEYLSKEYGKDVINNAVEAGVFSQSEYMEKMKSVYGLLEKNIIDKELVDFYQKIIDTYYGVRILAVKNNIEIDDIKYITERAFEKITDLLESLNPITAMVKSEMNHYGEFYLAWLENYNPYTEEIIK